MDSRPSHRGSTRLGLVPPTCYSRGRCLAPLACSHAPPHAPQPSCSGKAPNYGSREGRQPPCTARSQEQLSLSTSVTATRGGSLHHVFTRPTVATTRSTVRPPSLASRGSRDRSTCSRSSGSTEKRCVYSMTRTLACRSL